MQTIPVWWYLMVSTALFSLGGYVVLSRRNAVNVLMGIELMLNAVNLNAVALWRYISPTVPGKIGGETVPVIASLDGQVFALFVIALAAAEAAVGLALVIAIYRDRKTVELPELDLLQG